jgi:hypothetical protein
LVNSLQNKNIKCRVSPEQLSDFVVTIRDRIRQEIEREKTILPKEKLYQLDGELQANPQVAEAIIESFGFGVASDLFMLYGLIKKGKDLVRRTVNFYTVDRPSLNPGAKSLDQTSDAEIVAGLNNLWNNSPAGSDGGEFSVGDDIKYYSGSDVSVDDDNPALGLRRGDRVPGFRTIFGSTKKNKADECEKLVITSGSRFKETMDRNTTIYSLQFRDNNGEMKGNGLITGYPAESYIPGSGKKKALARFFERALIPEIRKNRMNPGIS